jgi:hypothetical protein
MLPVGHSRPALFMDPGMSSLMGPQGPEPTPPDEAPGSPGPWPLQEAVSSVPGWSRPSLSRLLIPSLCPGSSRMSVEPPAQVGLEPYEM